MSLTLYDYHRSSAAFRLRIALNLKGLAYERVFVDLLAGEQRAEDYLALNPQGFVPALADGETLLTQSLAIMEYLDERHPEPPLLPSDGLERARVRTLALAVACDIHPLNNSRVLKYLTGPMGLDEATKLAWYRHWIAEGLGPLEAMVAGSAAGRFCHGASVTLADVCLVPQIYNAQRFECPLSAYPTLMGIFETCRALPAFAAAWPEAVAPQTS